MLADLFALIEEQLGAAGRYIVICPADDEAARRCVNSVADQLAEPNRLRLITLEDLVTLRAGLERTSGPNYGDWVSSHDQFGRNRK